MRVRLDTGQLEVTPAGQIVPGEPEAALRIAVVHTTSRCSRRSAQHPPSVQSCSDPPRPRIYPTTITIDNGKVFVGHTFTTTCAYLGISVNISAPRTPTHKGIVERTFKTIASRFAQYLLSYKGRSVSRRGANVESQGAVHGHGTPRALQ